MFINLCKYKACVFILFHTKVNAVHTFNIRDHEVKNIWGFVGHQMISIAYITTIATIILTGYCDILDYG